VFHGGRGELGVVSQQRRQTFEVATVEDPAPFHLHLELGSAREPVLSRQSELGERESHPARHLLDALSGSALVVGGGAK
jgi:hypothetical protein